MPVTLQEKLDALPPDERKWVEDEKNRLLAEYKTLQEMRKDTQLTQQEIADQLNIKQSSVAQLEKRPDLLISTLRNYVEAMGGKLTLAVQFKGQPPVYLDGLGDVEEG